MFLARICFIMSLVTNIPQFSHSEDNPINLSKMNQGVVHFKLKNGLTVVLKEDRSNPVTAVHLRVETGSIHEKGYYGSGLSHFFEHSLFLGSKNHPEKDSYSAEIESYGGANVNAYTTYDHTAYHFTILSKYTLEGLKNIEDLVFHPLFPEKEVENEMGSILSEMDMGDDNPDRYFYKFGARVYFDKLPYKYPVIGYKELFSKLSRKELLDYYYRTYIPNNMILSLVGDFSIKEIIPQIEAVFGEHELKKNDDLLFENDDLWKYEVGETSHPKAKFTRLALAWQTVAHDDEDMYPLDVTASMIGSGLGSILYTRLKDELQLVENIDAYSWTPAYKGVFEISADLPVLKTRDEIIARINRVKKEILKIIKEVENGQFDEYRLSTVKREVLTSFVSGKETVLSVAQSLAGSVMNTGSIYYDEVYLNGIESVEKEAVKRVMKKYFSEKNMKMLIMTSPEHHKKGPLFGKDVIVNESIQEKAIPLTNGVLKYDVKGFKPSLKDLKKIKEEIKDLSKNNLLKEDLVKKKYKNGLTLLHRSSKKLPRVVVVLAVNGGVKAEIKSVPEGSFNFLANMFLTSNDQHSKQKLIQLFKENGIRIEPYSGKYSLGIKMSFLNDKVEEASKLLYSIVNNKNFNSEDFALEKSDILFDIESDEEDGWAVSGNQFRKLFFKKTAFSHPSEGTKKSIAKITTDSLMELKQTYLTPSNMVLSVYGDIALEKVEKEFVKPMEAWAIKEKTNLPEINLRALKPFNLKNKKDIHLNEQDGSKQAYFRMGFFAPPLGNEEANVFKVLSAYFSGMGGPLFKLRSEEFTDSQGNSGGRAYQLGVFYDDTKDYGALIFYAGLRYEARNEYPWAIESFKKEIEGLIKGNIPKEELNRAKMSLIGREVNASQRLMNKAFNEALHELYGFGAEAYLTTKEKIEKVKAEDVIELGKKYLQEDQFLVHVLVPK